MAETSQKRAQAGAFRHLCRTSEMITHLAARTHGESREH